VCSNDVALREIERIAERIIHVRLRREMHDRVNILRHDEVHHKIAVLDITFDEFEIGFASNVLQIVDGRAIIELVERDDLVLWVTFDQTPRHMRRDEACGAGDEDAPRPMRNEWAIPWQFHD
jgi:hypothetical protein